VVAGRLGGSVFSTSGGGWPSTESVFVRGSDEGFGWIAQPGQIQARLMIKIHFNKPATSLRNVDALHTSVILA
jgi:hypothetical protein